MRFSKRLKASFGADLPSSLLCLFFFLSIPACAEIPDVLYCEHYSLDEGLSGKFVGQVLQDRQGFIWLSTDGGLSRFDGYEFQIYEHEPNNLQSLSSNLVFSIWEDTNDLFWIGTYKGLHSLHRKTGAITRYNPSTKDLESQRENRITFLLEGDDDQLWVGTRGGGLGCLDKPTGTVKWFRSQPEQENTFRSNFLFTAAKESSGTLLISVQGGDLDRFDPQTGRVEHLVDRYPPPAVHKSDIISILVDSDDAIWYGTWSQGLVRLDPKTGALRQWIHDPTNPSSISNDIVHALYQDASGILWIGTRAGGIDLFDPTTETFRHIQLSIEGNLIQEPVVVQYIFQDIAGGYWLGTVQDGVFYYDPNAAWFEWYHQDPVAIEEGGLSSNLIFALCADQQGMVWIGTDGGGLNRFDPQTRTYKVFRHHPTESNSLLRDSVISLLADRNGNLWIGYWMDGLSRFDPDTETFTHYPESPHGLHGNTIRSLCEDSLGRIWIGTENFGVNVFDPTTDVFRYYPYDPENPIAPSDRYIRSIYEDHNKNIWVGTEGFGLNRYDPELDGFVHYPCEENSLSTLSGNLVTSLCEDDQGRLWVGTESGLNVLSPDRKTFTRYGINQGLPSNQIKALALDKQGVLWISTNRGISRYDILHDTFQNFDTRDKLQGLSYNSGCVGQTPSGEIYFGGQNGFNRFHPLSIPKNTYIPPVLLTSFQVMGRSIDWEEILQQEQRIQFPYNQNFFQFEFTALNYTRSYRNQYQYRLVGLEEQWTEPTQRRYVQYTSLKPGMYEFQVIASNNDGVWNEQGISIPLVIRAPFWDTLWFRGIVTGFLAIVLFVVYKLRVRSIHKQRVALQIEVERQTRRVVEQSHELERMNKKLERLSFLDGLTNIPNRRRFEEQLDQEWKRAIRTQEPISLIMIDIDLFKKYNDTYGHQGGDQCLRRIAKAIQQNAKRSADLSARFGGEEFVVLLPATGTGDAYAIAEMIRNEVESMKIPHDQSEVKPYVTLSLGVSTLIPERSLSSEILVRRADEALYRAKKEGRNRTLCMTDENK